MMSHGQDHQTVFSNLVHDAEWELGKNKSANALGYYRSGGRILTDTIETSVDLVREDQAQTGALVLVVVDSVVELMTGFGVDT